jgi:hypothetical protein
MKKAVFWDVAPCRNGVNRQFGGTYRLHLQGRREIIRNSAREASVPPKRRLTPFLHGAASQKTAFFIVTAVKTSNLTKYRMFFTEKFGHGKTFAYRGLENAINMCVTNKILTGSLGHRYRRRIMKVI